MTRTDTKPSRVLIVYIVSHLLLVSSDPSSQCWSVFPSRFLCIEVLCVILSYGMHLSLSSFVDILELQTKREGGVGWRRLRKGDSYSHSNFQSINNIMSQSEVFIVICVSAASHPNHGQQTDDSRCSEEKCIY